MYSNMHLLPLLILDVIIIYDENHAEGMLHNNIIHSSILISFIELALHPAPVSE